MAIGNNHYKFSLEHLQWDSDILGVKCGKLGIVVEDGDRVSGNAKTEFQSVWQKIKDDDYRFVTVKHNASDVDVVNALLCSNCKLVDTELTFTKDLEINRASNSGSAKGITVRKMKQFWEDSLYAISETLDNSRFFVDSNIDRSKALELWKESIFNSCHGRSSYLVVAFKDERPAGLIVVNESGEVANLFLVAVLPKYQGMGVGKEMMSFLEHEVSEGINKICVETQAVNYRAQSLYTKMGFINILTKHIFHCWL